MPVALAVVIAVAGGVPSPSALAQAPGGWTSLFDGRTLTGWNRVGTANWDVVDGVIEASSGTGYLVTPASYTDFQITLDFWVTPDANSGVFVRCADPAMITAMNAYEINIFDMRPDPAYRTGGIVNVAKPLSVINAGNRWNTFDITARGSKLTVVLNGTTVVDGAENADHARGPIALQYATGTVRFRNIRIRAL